jgi:transposase InsO family protein
MRAPERKAMAGRPGKDLSVRRQCALLNLARSGVYRPKPVTRANDLSLMRRIGELHLKLPCYGRRMMFELTKEGRGVNRKRVRRLSNTMDTSFCLAALDEALVRYGKPEIFNTGQGAQFTSAAFTGKLEAAGLAILMDGRGRFMNNIFIERLGRSIKYEEMHLKAYADGGVARWHRQNRGGSEDYGYAASL